MSHTNNTLTTAMKYLTLEVAKLEFHAGRAENNYGHQP